jgi:hypothetical protein
VYRQKCSSNAIDRTGLLALTSLQRWVSLLRSSRHRLQTPLPVPVTPSHGSGESRTWSTRSRANGDHGLSPLYHPLSPPIHHIILPHHRLYLCQKKQRVAVHNTFPLPFAPSHLFPFPLCAFLFLFLQFLGFVWCVLVIDILANGRLPFSRCFMRISLYHQCVCSLFCCITPPLSSPPDGANGYIGIIPPPIRFVHVCTITRSPLFLARTGHSSLLSLVIYFVVNTALLLPPILGCHYPLSSCLLLSWSRNQCIPTHP